MNKTILLVAPHPDDETLGCGGTILRFKNSGVPVVWLIVTRGFEEHGASKSAIENMEKQIKAVSDAYQFDDVIRLDFPTTLLDAIPQRELVDSFSSVVDKVKPETLYLPFRGDVHTDHRVVFDSAWSSVKSFRAPSIKNILTYETLSETEFNSGITSESFKPNAFCDISEFLKKKLEIFALYASEGGSHPFPRSSQAIEALATLRGSTAGVKYAEAYMTVKTIF